jgi:hypothetical protein
VTRRVLVVAGGTAKFSGRIVPPLLERLLEEGCTVVLASAAPVPADVQALEGVDVVSLRPSRWLPLGTDAAPKRTPIRGSTRVTKAYRRIVRRDFSARAVRKAGKYYPEYLVGRQTWGWVRASDASLAAAAEADLVVAANPDSVLAVWELGRRHQEPEIVLGVSGAEAVLDAWRRAARAQG